MGHKLPLILPGGYLIGMMLLVNLICAHIYRFQLTTKKIGIQIAHAGVILLLVGQLATDMLAREMQMHFSEGQTKDYSESATEYELNFISGDTGIAIPAKLLKPGDELKIDSLPFAIRVKTFWKNSDVSFRAPMMKNAPPLASNGVALNFDFRQLPDVKTTDEKNIPTAIIELTGPNGSLGDWVVSDWAGDASLVEAVQNSYAQQLGADMAHTIATQLAAPQSFEIDGKKFTFVMRPTRIRHPFSLTLLKATHTVYPGTDIPKDFRSRVQLKNPQTGENREVEISMNHPLRYDGLTFYQYQMDAGQVARTGRARAVVGAVGRAQPELVDALHRLRDGRCGTAHPVPDAPGRLCFQKENEMKKNFQKWFPPLLMLVMAAVVFRQLAGAEGQGFCLQRIWQIAGDL